jgi:ABC-type multidrug transport system ATPase subunit
MLEVVQLADRADELVKTYSGGMKRRLEIARGLLHYPQVLFLDEPTLGLDPQTRRAIWDHIQRLNRNEKVTIILTTHYTEEADYLCERILIIDFGKVVALDTPDKLKARLEGDVVSLVFKDPTAVGKVHLILKKEDWVRHIKVVTSGDSHAALSHMMQVMRELPGGFGMQGMMSGMNTVNIRGGRKIPEHLQQMLAQDMAGESGQRGLDGDSKCLNLLVDDGGHRIPEIVRLVDEAGVVLESVELHKPTLDDVFLSVTGRDIRDERGSFMEMVRRHRIVQQARGRRVRG